MKKVYLSVRYRVQIIVSKLHKPFKKKRPITRLNHSKRSSWTTTLTKKTE